MSAPTQLFSGSAWARTGEDSALAAEALRPDYMRTCLRRTLHNAKRLSKSLTVSVKFDKSPTHLSRSQAPHQIISVFEIVELKHF